MESDSLWDQVYLRCLEINEVSDGGRDSLENLSVQLSTIVEIIPSDLDPAHDFECFVMAKLCKSIASLIDKTLNGNLDINT